MYHVTGTCILKTTRAYRPRDYQITTRSLYGTWTQNFKTGNKILVHIVRKTVENIHIPTSVTGAFSKRDEEKNSFYWHGGILPSTLKPSRSTSGETIFDQSNLWYRHQRCCLTISLENLRALSRKNVNLF